MKKQRQESVIIVAGGRGLRAGGQTPKQFRMIGEKPVLMYSIEAFYRYNPEIFIVVVLPEGFIDHWEQLCSKYSFSIPHRTTVGGETRFHSVQNGLSLVSPQGCVAVHDGARPFVTRQLIGQSFAACAEMGCGIIPVIPEAASVRLLTENGGSKIISRDKLRLVQTPQVFPADALKDAYNEARFNPSFTDDASVFEKYGLPVRLIDGEASNIKITTPFDFLIAEGYLESMPK